RRERFGFLLQDASMISCFTVAENLRHTLALRGIHDKTRVVGSVTKMLIEGESAEVLLGLFPSQLSGGMRQRMALAAAIAHDPHILFAAEPTASLDDASGIEVFGVIRRWLDEKKGQRAFIFVTHREEMIEVGSGAPRLLRLDRTNGKTTFEVMPIG